MANAIEFIKYIGAEIIKNKQLLTELDQAIGDGDHGINMARGFEAVIAKIETLPETTDLSTVVFLKTCHISTLKSRIIACVRAQ